MKIRKHTILILFDQMCTKRDQTKGIHEGLL